MKSSRPAAFLPAAGGGFGPASLCPGTCCRRPLPKCGRGAPTAGDGLHPWVVTGTLRCAENPRCLDSHIERSVFYTWRCDHCRQGVRRTETEPHRPPAQQALPSQVPAWNAVTVLPKARAAIKRQTRAFCIQLCVISHTSPAKMAKVLIILLFGWTKDSCPVLK